MERAYRLRSGPGKLALSLVVVAAVLGFTARSAFRASPFAVGHDDVPYAAATITRAELPSTHANAPLVRRMYADPAVKPPAGEAHTTSATIFVPEGADPDAPVVDRRTDTR